MKTLLAFASGLATIIFILAVFALHFLAAEVDPMRSGISFYALSGYRLIIGIALGLAGAAGILLALALWSTTVSTASRIGLALLAAWGITSILAGIFPLDAPDAAPTLAGSIHNMAGLNFLLAASAVILIDVVRAKPAVSNRSRSRSYWLAWGVLILAVLLFIFNGPLFSVGIGGLAQRLYWLVLALWLVFKAEEVVISRSDAQAGVNAVS